MASYSIAVFIDAYHLNYELEYIKVTDCSNVSIHLWHFHY